MAGPWHKNPWVWGGAAAGGALGLVVGLALRPRTIGVLVAGPHRLRLTQHDALWAARMVVGEEGEDATPEVAALLVGVLLRRWAAVAQARGAPLWGSFTELLRAYSEPLQPRQAHRARPARIQALRWMDIPLHIRTAVLDVLAGRRPLALAGTGAVHFAQEAFARSRWQPDWRAVPSVADNLVVSSATGRAIAEPEVIPA